jgi:hypothetical protein
MGASIVSTSSLGAGELSQPILLAELAQARRINHLTIDHESCHSSHSPDSPTSGSAPGVVWRIGPD